MTSNKCRNRWHSTLLAILPIIFLVPSHPVDASSGDRWQRLTSEGMAALEQAQYQEAEQRFLSARQELDQSGTIDDRMATTFNNLALVLHEQRRFAEAKTHYEHALVVWEQTRGTDHPHVATALHNLAEIYLAEGKLEQAEEYYLRSLGIAEQAVEPSYADLAIGYNGLGMLYRKQGKLLQAETWFHLALAILEQNDGTNPIAAAPILNNLASLYKEKQLYVFAEPLY